MNRKKCIGTVSVVLRKFPARLFITLLFAMAAIFFIWTATDNNKALADSQPRLTVNPSADAGTLTSEPIQDGKIEVTATPADGYYLAQIRMETGSGSNAAYRVLDADSSYPCEESAKAEIKVPDQGETKIYADFIPVKWDGTVDISWYDPEKSAYDIKYAAQFAGASALCNGLFNDFPNRQITIGGQSVRIPDVKDQSGSQVDPSDDPDVYKEGKLPNDGSCYHVFANNNADGKDTLLVGDLSQLIVKSGLSDSTGTNNVTTTNNFWFGGEDFREKTIRLKKDLDMGGQMQPDYSGSDPGSDGSAWTGPNYMPLGGTYVMDVANGYTKIGAGFNGHLDGTGHIVKNICMKRHVSTGEFGNSEGTGLVGMLGTYRTEISAHSDPSVKNVAVSGLIYGNRMVGGIVGRVYHGKKTEINGCMNFATVYNTDAKGCGGIVGAGLYYPERGDTQPLIKNCVNFGYVCTGYNKNAGGLVGRSEAIVTDSYNVGYVGHDGSGEKESANSLGTNNGGAVWSNVYGLKGSSWFEVSGMEDKPGTKTAEVWGSTSSSAIMRRDTLDSIKTPDFTGMLNGKLKSDGVDSNGYIKSEDSIIKGTKKNWVRGAESAEKQFVSAGVREAFNNVSSWKDPTISFGGLDVSSVAKKLRGPDTEGMPVPAAFMGDAAQVTQIVTSGTPRLEYLEGETFSRGDSAKPSANPNATEDSEFTVWAKYDDGSFEEIDDFEVKYQNGSVFKAGDTKVTVTASLGGKTLSKEFDVTVGENRLLSMKVTSQPTSVLYARDEYFSPNGMTITSEYGNDERKSMATKATWKDSKLTVSMSTEKNDSGIFINYKQLAQSEAQAYTYSFSPGLDKKLDPDEREVTVSQTFSDVTKTCPVPVTVQDSTAPDIIKDSNENWTIDIDSADDFRWFKNKIDTGEKTDLNAKLKTDISITDDNYEPVGYYRDNIIQYQGTFEGEGHTINVNIMNDSHSIALFQTVGDKGVIKDLNTAGSIRCGNEGTEISTSNNAAASICVTLWGGTIENCVNSCDIKVNSGVNAGGIAGIIRTNAAISNVRNTGDIEGRGVGYIGGIAGVVSGGTINPSLTDCYNTGEIKANEPGDDIYSGGITGAILTKGNEFTMKDCHNAGLVFTDKGYAGAITGSAANTTSKQLENITGNKAAGGTAFELTGQQPTAAGVIIKDINMCFEKSLKEQFQQKDMGDEYADSISKTADIAAGLIGAIGSVSSSSKDVIEKARKYYDSLDPEIQNQVGNYSALTEAEKKYAEISGDSGNSGNGGSGSEGDKDVPAAKTDIGTVTVVLKPAVLEYSGKKMVPKILAGNLKEKVDYTVSFKNNTAIGTAEATVTGIGKYTGKISKKYTIIPAKIKNLKLKKGKKKFTLQFKKSGGGVKYQVAYRINKSKKWKTRTLTTNKGTIKKLKSKKKYQIRVRGFKKVKGKTYYGGWTKVKKVKIK